MLPNNKEKGINDATGWILEYAKYPKAPHAPLYIIKVLRLVFIADLLSLFSKIILSE
jgi:hypothetical protein